MVVKQIVHLLKLINPTGQFYTILFGQLLKNNTVCCSELPAHVVSRVVVKHTFIDVEDEVSEEDQDSRWEIPLTPPLDPGTDNAEFDEWRRAYRRFRLGHHQGAKGEATPEKMHTRQALDWLDVRGEVVMWAPAAA